MKQVKSLMVLILVIVVFVGVAIFIVANYSWVFAKTVDGKIVEVRRVTHPTAVLGSRITSEQLHSYAVLIEGQDGRLYTASSEDRQWEVAGKGYCVKALLYRYPPWDFERANTFFNARLKELRQCDGQTPALPKGAPENPSAPAPPAAAPDSSESSPAQ